MGNKAERKKQKAEERYHAHVEDLKMWVQEVKKDVEIQQFEKAEVEKMTEEKEYMDERDLDLVREMENRKAIIERLLEKMKQAGCSDPVFR